MQTRARARACVCVNTIDDVWAVIGQFFFFNFVSVYESLLVHYYVVLLLPVINDCYSLKQSQNVRRLKARRSSRKQRDTHGDTFQTANRFPGNRAHILSFILRVNHFLLSAGWRGDYASIAVSRRRFDSTPHNAIQQAYSRQMYLRWQYVSCSAVSRNRPLGRMREMTMMNIFSVSFLSLSFTCTSVRKLNINL